jgi:hypothetical protein
VTSDEEEHTSPPNPLSSAWRGGEYRAWRFEEMGAAREKQGMIMQFNK